MKNTEEWGALSPLGATIAGLPYIDLSSSNEEEVEKKYTEILASINEKVCLCLSTIVTQSHRLLVILQYIYVFKIVCFYRLLRKLG